LRCNFPEIVTLELGADALDSLGQEMPLCLLRDPIEGKSTEPRRRQENPGYFEKDLNAQTECKIHRSL
jgi:hypothetical protein